MSRYHRRPPGSRDLEIAAGTVAILIVCGLVAWQAMLPTLIGLLYGSPVQ